MPPEIVVIGAGVSGLSCARKLFESGMRVHVLEARKRIGGRISTYRPADGGPGVEMGAQVVHGPRNVLHAVVPGMRPVPRSGQTRVLIGGAGRPLHSLARTADPPWMLERRLAAADIEDIPLSAWHTRSGLAPGPGLAAAEEWARQNWAAEPAHLSARGMAAALRDDDALGDGDFLPARGYDELPALLARDLADAGAVTTGSPVRDVSTTKSGVEVRTDQQCITPRAVVVTVPPSVIGSGALHISGLSRAKRAALPALASGDGCCAAVTLGRCAAPEDAVVFDADGTGGFLRCVQGRPEVLIVAKGRAAQRLRAALTHPPLLKTLLDAAFPWIGPAAVASVSVADWGRDPWSEGVFTTPLVGAGAGISARAWAAPTGGRIFFAGEATCARPARVHGAYLSGIRAAEQVLEVWGH